MSSVQLVVIFGLYLPLSGGWVEPTYIADISHVPLVLPEPPRHVDIGGRSGYRGMGTAVPRQAVADHPCQDGAEGPGQAAHPCASFSHIPHM